ncbi:MAG: peroxiredoxin-like family protein [Cyanobacteria bacterium J06638_6]
MTVIASYEIFEQTQRPRVSDGVEAPLLSGCDGATQVLVLVWPQLGDFDSLEYAWWLQRAANTLAQRRVAVRAVGIGDRALGQRFCAYTGFPPDCLYMDETAALHRQLGLYEGLGLGLPGLKPGQSAWLNLMLMCAGIASPGTLREVLRGYTGDRKAPQLIDNDETIQAGPLPPLTGQTFSRAGGSGFQRPFELATLRLRNMTEVLGHWGTYVPNAAYLTQRGGTFLFDADGALLYEHRDRGILGFAADMANPLAFLEQHAPTARAV